MRMTPKGRFTAAAERREPDRVPRRRGFILGSCHDVLLPTPKENFMAMVEVALSS